MKQILVAVLLMGCVIALAGCRGTPQEVPDAELMNTLWVLESIEVPGEPDILPDANKIFSIHFFEDFHLSGMNDCNEYFGIFTISNENLLNIDSLLTTLMGCGESIDQEYYYTLHFVNSYEIINNMLRIYFDENNSVLNYIKDM